MSVTGRRSGAGDDDDDDASSPSRAERREGPRSWKTVALLAATELIKWLVIMASIFLSVWQYRDIRDAAADGAAANGTKGGYAECGFGEGNTVAEFWGIFTGIMLGISLLLYLPWRFMAIKMRFRFYVFRDERWSVITSNYYAHYTTTVNHRNISVLRLHSLAFCFRQLSRCCCCGGHVIWQSNVTVGGNISSS